MRVSITTKNCSYCKNKLDNWDYRFQGKHYCRICYDRFFELTKCVKCHKKKKIFIFLSQRICKKCLVKDKPCIRCGKIKYAHGLISQYGPVCQSCSIYYREYKKCGSCQKESYDISNRTLLKGNKKLLCTNCYNKTLPLCPRCHRHAKPYISPQAINICRTCATEEDRICRQCYRPFPAGRGRICKNCSYANILKRKADTLSSALSNFTSTLFQDFSVWLKDRRAVLYASLHIQKYYIYFQELDNLSVELNKFPNYFEITQYLALATSKQYLLVTLFLQDIGKISINKIIQEEFSNIAMTDRLLQYFSNEDVRYCILHKYYSTLQNKSKLGKRSIRLALTPAAKFLKYCEYFQNIEISNESLGGYLWVYRGQTSAIYGFITFLNNCYGFSLDAHRKHIPITTSRYSKKQLRQKYINLLRNPQSETKYNQKLLHITLGYFHNLGIPSNAFISYKDIKKEQDGTYYIRLISKKFYLPVEAGNILIFS